MRLFAAACSVVLLGLAGGSGTSTMADPETPLANGSNTLTVPVNTAVANYPLTPNPGDGRTVAAQRLAVPAGPANRQPRIRTYGLPIEGAAPMVPQVSNEYPNRALAYIHTGSLPEDCTGFLYGPDIVATAGHCVALGGNGQFANMASVVVHPAYNMGDSPFGECHATRLYSTAAWVVRGDPRFDYGAIKLDCRVGDHTGWLGLSQGDTLPVGTKILIDGYADQPDQPCPTTFPGRPRPCAGSGDVRALLAGRIFYFASTYQVMSGSPVIAPARNRAVAIGIHAYSFNHQAAGPEALYNSGTVLSARRLQNLRVWRGAR